MKILFAHKCNRDFDLYLLSNCSKFVPRIKKAPFSGTNSSQIIVCQ